MSKGSLVQTAPKQFYNHFSLKVNTGEGNEQKILQPCPFLGLSNYLQVPICFFSVILLVSLISLIGNVLLIWFSQLHNISYLFASKLSFLDICYCNDSSPHTLVSGLMSTLTLFLAHYFPQKINCLLPSSTWLPWPKFEL